MTDSAKLSELRATTSVRPRDKFRPPLADSFFFSICSWKLLRAFSASSFDLICFFNGVNVVGFGFSACESVFLSSSKLTEGFRVDFLYTLVLADDVSGSNHFDFVTDLNNGPCVIHQILGATATSMSNHWLRQNQ